MSGKIPGGPFDRGCVILLLAFLLQTVLLAWFGVLRPERMVVKGVDPVCYYSYTRSILFDGDLDLRNEFERLQEGGLPRHRGTAIGPPVPESPLSYYSSYA